MHLRDSSVQVEFPTPDRLEIAARLASEDGFLEAQGAVDAPFGEYQGDFTLTGENFQAVNNEQAIIVLSPDLQATVNAEQVQVAGEVNLPIAMIELTEVPQAAVQPSADQVLLDALEDEDTQAPVDVVADLSVILGDEVTFSGFGLEAQFGGELKIMERPDEPTVGQGEISIVAGSYQAYGQDLTIEDGKLIWVGGALADPGMDILALRQPKPDIKVGVRARGTLSKPKIELTSTPALSQSDQLSYLVLGRPLEGSSSAEGSYLNRAALALGIKGGNYLTERYGDQLGVDQIGIETAPGEGADQAALVVGKYLSPRLYVSYGLSLLDSISTLRLEYTLNKNWSLQTESSALQSGGDIRYSIELGLPDTSRTKTGG